LEQATLKFEQATLAANQAKESMEKVNGLLYKAQSWVT
jgi:hypothetical protein